MGDLTTMRAAVLVGDAEASVEAARGRARARAAPLALVEEAIARR
jgi:hypothetical protein